MFCKSRLVIQRLASYFNQTQRCFVSSFKCVLAASRISPIPQISPHRSSRRREDRILTSPARRMASWKMPYKWLAVWMGKSGENLEWSIAMFEYRTQRSWQMVNSKRLWLGWPFFMRGNESNRFQSDHARGWVTAMVWRTFGTPSSYCTLKCSLPKNDSGSMLYPWLKNNSYMATILPWMLKKCLMRQQGNNWRARSFSVPPRFCSRSIRKASLAESPPSCCNWWTPKFAEGAEPHKLSWS